MPTSFLPFQQWVCWHPVGAHPWTCLAGLGSPLHPLSPQRPTGEVYDIEIDTLETTCHVLDPTPLANCSVRQQTQHVSGPLRATAGVGWGGAPTKTASQWRPP